MTRLDHARNYMLALIDEGHFKGTKHLHEIVVIATKIFVTDLKQLGDEVAEIAAAQLRNQIQSKVKDMTEKISVKDVYSTIGKIFNKTRTTE